MAREFLEENNVTEAWQNIILGDDELTQSLEEIIDDLDRNGENYAP